MWLDSRGRLFGKLNLLDLLALLFFLCLGGMAVYAAGVSRYRALQVVSVEPARVVAGPRRYVVVKGTGFDSSTTLWLGDYISRSGVYWDESTLGIEINERIEPGVYPLRVRDGHGRIALSANSLEIVWKPKIAAAKPKTLYSTGPGARLEITGNYFSPSCRVRLGEVEVPAERNAAAPGQILSADFSHGPPLPLGRHRLTVTNAGAQSHTWEEEVTVVPAPQVTSVAPDWILLGDTVDLILYGKNFQPGTTVWLDEEFKRLGEAAWVSPTCMKIRLTTHAGMAAKPWDLFLELKDGPKMKAADDLVYISPSPQVFIVATVLLDEPSGSAMALRNFRDSVEGRLRRPLGSIRLPAIRQNYNKDRYPIVEVLLPARAEMREGTFAAYDHRGRPLRRGMPVWFNINGQELAGTLVFDPFAVLSDDYFENKRAR